MSNSKLVSYTNLSPNNSGQRQHSIDRISPHCVVAQWTAEQIGVWFAQKSAKASSNYGIGKDGKIGMYVEEKNRSWCTSSSANDNRAVTIECASDSVHPYAMTDAVYQSLIKLCVDICKRNGKTKLIWWADKNKALNYNPAANEMVMTVHRWFANKACPGDWLYSRLTDLANKVNAQLGSSSGGTATADTPTEPAADTLLKKGSEGPAVEKLQANLNKLGAKLDVDGDFGAKTRAAVVAFQKKNGLDPDGIVGPMTAAAIEKKVAELDKKEDKKEESKKEEPSAGKEFKVRVSIQNLNIRSGPGKQFQAIGFCPVGAYTIVDTASAGGVTWGELKSGAGWICLEYVERI